MVSEEVVSEEVVSKEVVSEEVVLASASIAARRMRFAETFALDAFALDASAAAASVAYPFTPGTSCATVRATACNAPARADASTPRGASGAAKSEPPPIEPPFVATANADDAEDDATSAALATAAATSATTEAEVNGRVERGSADTNRREDSGIPSNDTVPLASPGVARHATTCLVRAATWFANDRDAFTSGDVATATALGPADFTRSPRTDTRERALARSAWSLVSDLPSCERARGEKPAAASRRRAEKASASVVSKPHASIDAGTRTDGVDPSRATFEASAAIEATR